MGLFCFFFLAVRWGVEDRKKELFDPRSRYDAFRESQ